MFVQYLYLYLPQRTTWMYGEGSNTSHAFIYSPLMQVSKF